MVEQFAPTNLVHDLAQVDQPESWQTKALREMDLVGTGLSAFGQCAEQSLDRDHIVGTVGKVAMAAGISLAMERFAPSVGVLGLTSRAAGLGMGLSFLADLGRQGDAVASALVDNWQSARNWDQNSQVMRDSLGNFAFDSVLMSAGGLAGGMSAGFFRKPCEIGLNSAERFKTAPIPKFDQNGYLPPGMHQTTWPEFSRRFGFNDQRKEILGALQEAAGHIKNAGGSKIIVGGSFVSNTAVPHDFDAAWLEAGVDKMSLPPDIARQMPGVLAGKPSKGDFYPAMTDFHGLGMWFEALSRGRDGQAVGTVSIDLATVPAEMPGTDILADWRKANQDANAIAAAQLKASKRPLEERQNVVDQLMLDVAEAVGPSREKTIKWLGQLATVNDGATFDKEAVARALGEAGYKSGAYQNDPLVKVDRQACADWVIGQCKRVLENGKSIPFFVSSFASQFEAH